MWEALSCRGKMIWVMIRTVAELNTLEAFPGLILLRDRGIWGAPLI
jgi:hypothetical protein